MLLVDCVVRDPEHIHCSPNPVQCTIPTLWLACALLCFYLEPWETFHSDAEDLLIMSKRASLWVAFILEKKETINTSRRLQLREWEKKHAWNSAENIVWMVVFVLLEETVLLEKAELTHAEGVWWNYPNVNHTLTQIPSLFPPWVPWWSPTSFQRPFPPCLIAESSQPTKK